MRHAAAMSRESIFNDLSLFLCLNENWACRASQARNQGRDRRAATYLKDWNVTNTCIAFMLWLILYMQRRSPKA